MKLLFILSSLLLYTTTALRTSKTNLRHVKQNPLPEHLRRRRRRTQDLTIPDGTWKSRGYGWVLTSQNNSQDVKLFEETEISCIPNSVGIGLSYIEDIILDDTNTTLQIGIRDAVPKYSKTFDKVLPNSTGGYCSTGEITPVLGDDEYTRDALIDFWTFAATFGEQYAFFELRGIDWSDAVSQVLEDTALASNSTDEELFDALTTLLEPTYDSHVALRDPVNDQTFLAKPHLIFVQLAEEFAQQTEIEDYETYVLTQIFTWNQIVASYMDDDGLQGELKLDGNIIYGRFRDANIGYMQIFGFEPEDREAFEEQANKAFEALHDTDAIVFDNRVNGGGSDTVQLYIASHFVPEKEPVLAFRKRARDGDGYTESIDIYIPPLEDPKYRYDGKVVLVVSESTVSAAETFTIGMKQLPQTTILGRNTAGALSDILSRSLPNGWGVSLSNEEYTAPDGTLYEKDGVPPDVLPDAELLPLSERQEGIDSWLELALETAISSSDTTTTPEPTEPTQAPTEDSSSDRRGASLAINCTVYLLFSIVMITNHW